MALVSRLLPKQVPSAAIRRNFLAFYANLAINLRATFMFFDHCLRYPAQQSTFS